jgi:hypothetical protein
MIELENESEDLIPQLVTRLTTEIINSLSLQQYFTHVWRIQQSHHMQQRTFP